MKTFIILLSCLACCITARRLGLTQKQQWLESIGQDQQEVSQCEQGYTAYGNAEQRQKFLLDVLLQVQKPLANSELIQMGETLVTEPNMYIKPNDVILQEFLQQARNQQILGRRDVYNAVDMTNVRQLVGLQRFFVLARDYNVFQKNVVYARLYFNAVMFVDALTLAIRERPDTQDLVMPPMNEILPQLYYDNYVLYSAQNVDFEKLLNQVERTYTKSGLLDLFGSLLPVGKYGSYKTGQQGRMQYGRGSEISAEVVLPVENQGSLSTELSNDIQLDVAWKNIIIDQLAQTATECIENGQQIGGIGSEQRYYQQGKQSQYEQGGYSGIRQQQYDGQSQRYGGRMGEQYGYGAQGQYRGQSSYQGYGNNGQGFVDSNELPQVNADSERLLPIGRRRRVNSNSGYSTYVNPFYGPRNQYGYENQEYGTYGSYGQEYGGKPYQGASQYGYNDQRYGSAYTGAYGPQQYRGYQEAQYDTENKRYGSYYGKDRQQYQGQYGDNDQGYGSSYTRAYGPQQNQRDQRQRYERQQYQGAQYDTQNKKYDSYYGKDRQQYRGQYGYNDQGCGSSYTGACGSQQYQGAEYGYKGQKYGSYYDGSDRQQYQGPYSYNDQEYSSAYTSTYGPQKYQNKKDGSYYGQKYQGPYDNQNKEYDSSYTSPYGHHQTKGASQYGYKNQQYGYGGKSQYGNDAGSIGGILQCISAAKQLNYERRGEILLQSIQELAARLNIERIVDAVEGNDYKQKQQQYSQAQKQITQVMQQMRTLIEQVCEERSISKSSEATLNIIADIINGRLILGRQQQQQLSNAAQGTLQSLQQQIANILGYQVGPVNEVTPLALFFGNLREPLTQQIIIAFAELIDDYRQQLQPYTKQQLIGTGDVAVKNVQITPLITYTEYTDADLINLLDELLLQSNTNNLQRLSQKVVARQQRLNHEPFTISMDIAAERPQEVAVRVLLVPQIDYNDRRVSLTQTRQNYIVIDTFVKRLQSGNNYIQRSSRQFNGYNNDATTISQLYRQVMTGQISQQQQSEQQLGSIRQLPRNLLLPRGTNVNGGLPVQIVVVATPLTQQDRQMLDSGVYAQQISGLGIAAVGADQLPLGYPLDREVADEQSLNVPNIQVIETAIQYDNVIRV